MKTSHIATLGILPSLIILLLSGCETIKTENSAEAELVQRHLWVTGLKPEKAANYEALHANPWPGVTKQIRESNIRNMSIYKREIDGRLYLFLYLEYVGDDFEADMAAMAEDPETQRWWKKTDPTQIPLPEAAARGEIWADTVEVFHQP